MYYPVYFFFSLSIVMKRKARFISLSLICVPLQLSPTDKSLEFDRDFRIRHYAGDVV